MDLWDLVVVFAAGIVLTIAVAAGIGGFIAYRRRPRSGSRNRAPHRPHPEDRVRTTGSASTDTDATQPFIRITNVPLAMPFTDTQPNAIHRAPDGGHRPAPDDSTIALPLSNAPWAERPKSAPGTGTDDTSGEAAEVGRR